MHMTSPKNSRTSSTNGEDAFISPTMVGQPAEIHCEKAGNIWKILYIRISIPSMMDHMLYLFHAANAHIRPVYP